MNLRNRGCTRGIEYALSALLIVSGLFGLAAFRYVDGYEVAINGKTIGIVKDIDSFERDVAFTENKLSRALGLKVTLDRSTLEFNKEKVSIKQLSPEVPLADRLAVEASFQVSGKEISVDGETAAFVLNDTVAREIFDYYFDQVPETEQYVYIGFAGDVEVKNYSVPANEIMTFSSALQTLERSNALTIETREVLEYEEEIPYTEIIEEDSNSLIGTRQVVERGRSGKKLVKASVIKRNGKEVGKEILTEEVIKEPVPERIAVGISTFEELYFTGIVDWPLFGYITSRYGPRWGSFHRGIDIAANEGDPIYAADGGVVIFAGYYGDYGNLIQLQHTNGITTYYGHCSEIYVEVGDKVRKGDLIGAVGSTGFATGPHLHFEVRQWGEAQDPFDYLD